LCIAALSSVVPAFRVRLAKLTEELTTSLFSDIDNATSLLGSSQEERSHDVGFDSKLMREGVLRSDASSVRTMPHSHSLSLLDMTVRGEHQGETGKFAKRIALTFAAGCGIVALCGCLSASLRSLHSQSEARVHEDTSAPAPHSSLADSQFTEVAGSDQVFRYLGWCDAELAQTLVKPIEEALEVLPITSPWNERALTSVLAEHGITVGNWSLEARQNLSNELQSGEARLLGLSQTVVREIDLVMLVIEYVPENLVLLMAPNHNGDSNGSPERTPSTRRLSCESVLDAAHRTLRTSFPESLIGVAMVQEDILNIVETQETTSCHQGLQTILRKLFVRVTLDYLSDEEIESVGLKTRRLECNGVKYEWSKAQQSIAVHKHLRRTYSKSMDGSLPQTKRKSASTNILDLGRTPIQPWTANNVADILQQNGVGSCDSYFGLSMIELVDVLNTDGISLGIRQRDKKLVGFEDVVALYAACPEHGVVVEKHAEEGSVNFALPAVHTLPQESILSAARRAAGIYFGPDCKGTMQFDDSPPEEVVARISASEFSL